MNGLFGAVDKGLILLVILEKRDDSVRHIFIHRVEGYPREVDFIRQPKPTYLKKDTVVVLANGDDFVDQLILRLGSLSQVE